MLAIPPDFSFVVQIVSFLILWMGMKRLVWDSMVEVLEKREARTKGARHEAEELRLSADSSAAEYDRRMQEVRAAVGGEAKGARAAIESEERNILGEARAQASAQLAQLRDNLTRQAEDARAGIASEAQGLAREMVNRVVGRALS